MFPHERLRHKYRSFILLYVMNTDKRTSFLHESFASEGIRHVLDELKSKQGDGSWVSYDPDQDVVYVRQSGSMEGLAYYPWDIGNRAFQYLSGTTAEERAIADGIYQYNKALENAKGERLADETTGAVPFYGI